MNDATQTVPALIDKHWRVFFSRNAQDYIQVQRAFAGDEIFVSILQRCFENFKGRTMSSRTVCRVLDELIAETEGLVKMTTYIRERDNPDIDHQDFREDEIGTRGTK